jgi:membrane protease YdiL (CAAX protease family)
VYLPGEDIILNGSWENNHRNITAAAVTGLLVIGVIYFNVQSILVMVVMLAGDFFTGSGTGSESISSAEAIGREFKIPVLITLVISQYLFMLTPAVYVIKKWHTTNVIKYLRVRIPSSIQVILAVLITLSLLPFCYYLSELLLDLLGVPKSYRDVSGHLFAAKSTGQFIFLVFVVAVTPAICEESFFRGYFQRTLERTIGMKSFIWTGVLFGLFHMQPLGLINLSLLGLFFSYFYYKSKSIFPSSAAHFTNNLIALLLMYAPQKFGFILNGRISLWIVSASLLSAAVLLKIFIMLSEKNEESAAPALSN